MQAILLHARLDDYCSVIFGSLLRIYDFRSYVCPEFDLDAFLSAGTKHAGSKPHPRVVREARLSSVKRMVAGKLQRKAAFLPEVKLCVSTRQFPERSPFGLRARITSSPATRM